MINNNSRTGQAFWLGIGNLISFSFGIISAAILSRFLSIEEYGTYRQVLYVYNTLLIVFTLGMPRAYSFFLARIPIEQGKRTISKINGSFLFLGALFSIVLFSCAGFIGDILNNNLLPSAIRYFALTPMFLLPVLGLESIMATYKKNKFATLYIILSRVFNLICIVIPVLLVSPTATAAVIGFTVSSALCCIVGLIIERRPFKGVQTENSNLSLKDVFIYSLPLLIASLWAIVINSAPQFFISRWYGTDAFAEFANGFIELPFAGMVISAVAAVLLPEISRLSKEKSKMDEVLRVWCSSFEKSAKIIYPLAIFACVFAAQIINFLYGAKYARATTYFQLILVINLVRVVPYAPIMMGMALGRQYALANIIPAVTVIIIDYFWVQLFHSPYGIAALQCFIIIMHVSLMLYYISKHIKISILELIPLKFCLKIIILSFASSFIALITILMFFYSISSIYQLIIGVFLFGIGYLIFCTIFGISYSEFNKSLFSTNK